MLNGICFLAGTTKSKDGYYIMSLGDKKVDGNDNDSYCEVPLSANELVVELDTLNNALHSQDHF